MPYSSSGARYTPHTERGFNTRWMPEAPPRARANGRAAMVTFEVPPAAPSVAPGIATAYADATDNPNKQQVSMVAHSITPTTVPTPNAG